LIGNNGWSEHNTGKDLLTTDELIEKWVNEERRINHDMEEIYLKAMLDKEEKEG
jgi:hypothetical protein